jgi:hypothetical protein
MDLQRNQIAKGDRPKPWKVNLLPLLPAAVVPPVHGEAVYLGGLASVSAAVLRGAVRARMIRTWRRRRIIRRPGPTSRDPARSGTRHSRTARPGPRRRAWPSPRSAVTNKQVTGRKPSARNGPFCAIVTVVSWADAPIRARRGRHVLCDSPGSWSWRGCAGCRLAPPRR